MIVINNQITEAYPKKLAILSTVDNINHLIFVNN